MNKKQLIESVALSQGSSLKQAEGFVQATLDQITGNLKGGQQVDLHGFGKFEVSFREARTGRNPSTGEPVEIPAKKNVKFKPAKALTDALNK